jgi:hypothetical protein
MIPHETQIPMDASSGRADSTGPKPLKNLRFSEIWEQVQLDFARQALPLSFSSDFVTAPWLDFAAGFQEARVPGLKFGYQRET